MKKCPFCGEMIQDAAVKCRFCAEFISPGPIKVAAPAPVPWYFKNKVIVLAVLFLGPFAFLCLPLVWLNPKFSAYTKWTISAIVALVSLGLGLAASWAMKRVFEYYNFIFNQLGSI